MAVYACSDIHGQYELFKQIKSFLQPDDIVYFLGDAMDRGPSGWKIMKEILCDNRFIYLRGNHENMLIDAINEYFKLEHFGSKCQLVLSNGGNLTLDAILRESEQFAIEWANQLKKLPIYAEYSNTQGKQILLSHAGFTPHLDNNNNLIIPSDYDLIWNREHFYDEFDAETFPNTIIVHGHTPIPYIIEDLRLSPWTRCPGPLWYDNNHKVCLDSGAFATKLIYLLNLDTFEHITFN